MLKQFCLGFIEFRSSFTTHFEDCYYYDKGRDLAHKLTLRIFEK